MNGVVATLVGAVLLERFELEEFACGHVDDLSAYVDGEPELRESFGEGELLRDVDISASESHC